MKKVVGLFLLLSLMFLSPLANFAEAKGKAYYKSAKTGRFTTKSYSSKNKSTTYKSYFK